MSKIFACLTTLLIIAFCYYSSFAQPSSLMGQVINAKADTVSITRYNHALTTPVEKRFLKLENNYWSWLVETEQDSWMIYSYQEDSLCFFLQPGDQLSIQYLEGQLKATKPMSGKGSSNFDLFQKINSQCFYYPSTIELKEKLNQYKIDAWEVYCYNERKKAEAILKKDSVGILASTSFKNLLMKDVIYNYWHHILAFANQHRQILPDLILTGMDAAKINDPSALNCLNVYRFNKALVDYQFLKLNNNNPFPDNDLKFRKKLTIAKSILKDFYYLQWLSDEIKLQSPELSFQGATEFLKQLKALDSASIFYPEVALIVKNGPHKAASPKEKEVTTKTDYKVDDTISFNDLAGNTVNLKNYKGKVLYIDFWASWCGPCRATMPASKAIHQQLNRKEKDQILFVYISIDADEKAWRNSIEQLGIEGIQLHSPGNWKSKACEYFKINSIPRYMIIDKKGNIVNDNAPRPNAPELLDELRKYNN
ncbi:MAG: hypothetical protein RIQ89_206 [Bacteroidota bacterium]